MIIIADVMYGWIKVKPWTLLLLHSCVKSCEDQYLGLIQSWGGTVCLMGTLIYKSILELFLLLYLLYPSIHPVS